MSSILFCAQRDVYCPFIPRAHSQLCDQRGCFLVNMSLSLAAAFLFILSCTDLRRFPSLCLHVVSCPAPQRNFEIAFKMFDLNGDGEVDLEEFEQVSLSTAIHLA